MKTKNFCWKTLMRFYKNRCLMCGCERQKLTRDHIIPKSLGGPKLHCNLQPLCTRCNTAKSALCIDFRQTPAVWNDNGALRKWTPSHTNALLLGVDLKTLRQHQAQIEALLDEHVRYLMAMRGN